MNKKILFLLVPLFALMECKKTTDEPLNPDVVQRIFRVLSTADAKYDMSVLEIYPNTAKGDTIRNLTSSGLATDLAFVPNVGSRIVVDFRSTQAKTLNCTVGYKGVRLGIDSLQKTGNGLKGHFEYVVKD